MSRASGHVISQDFEMIGKNWFLAFKIDNQFIELGGMLKLTLNLQYSFSL